MSTEIEQAIDEFESAVIERQCFRDHPNIDIRIASGKAKQAARARLLALLAPEPEPTMLGMDPLESVSEYREDRLKITFTPSPHRPNALMVKLAGSWTGLTLVRLNVSDGAAWIVPQRPQLGPFRVRGEAVAAAIVTTFDPDNDPTPEPEPSEREIEAGAKALEEILWRDDGFRVTPYERAKAVLTAARAARQTGGAS